MSRAKAEELGRCRAGRDRRARHRRRSGPVAALAAVERHQQALGQEGSTVADVDLFEINEAFAAVGVAVDARPRLATDIVNVNGGAIALGHPIGMSGARLALHLPLELRRRGGGLGAAALCGGGGQGEALLLRVSA